MKRLVLAAFFTVMVSACAGGAEEVARPTGFEPPVLPFNVEVSEDVDPFSPLVQSRTAFGLPSSQAILDELEARNEAEPDRFDWLFLTNKERIDFLPETKAIEAQSEIVRQWAMANDGFISSANYASAPMTQEMVVFYTEDSAFGTETPALFPSIEFRPVPWTRDELQAVAEQWAQDGLVDPDGVASPIINAGISSSGGLVVILRYGTDWGTVTPLLGDDVRLVTEVLN